MLLRRSFQFSVQIREVDDVKVCCQFEFLQTNCDIADIVQSQTEVECTCSVVQCTLQVHCSSSSVAGVYTAHAVYHTTVLHSEKFEMNEEVDSLLSEKVSNFLLT